MHVSKNGLGFPHTFGVVFSLAQPHYPATVYSFDQVSLLICQPSSVVQWVDETSMFRLLFLNLYTVIKSC